MRFMPDWYKKIDKLLILLLMFSGDYCVAEPKFYGEIDHFGFSALPASHPMLLSTQMMDDDTLLQAAEIQREYPSSEQKRRLNYQWLLTHHNRSYQKSGSAQLARALRNTLINYWKANFRQGVKPNKSYGAESTEVSFQANYKLRISDDRFLIAYQYHF